VNGGSAARGQCTDEDAAALGYVDGLPVPRARLERRLAALRVGPRSASLPAPGSAEGRQLARWLVQVILTEELCAAEATSRGLLLDEQPYARLDARAEVEYGSINAAAYQHSAAVRAVCEAVTAAVRVPPDDVGRYWSTVARTEPQRWLLRHRLDDGPYRVIGPTAAHELPAALAAALGSASAGDTVTAADRLGRHEAYVLDVLPERAPSFERDAPALHDELLAAARRRAFAAWLDRARAARVRLVAGLEHPGDPRQPDNHHRH
jgi:[acyl-carrier-protein] S-malonyltransferase